MSILKRKYAFVGAVATISLCRSFAQFVPQVPAKPKFDVASVKLNDSNGPAGLRGGPGTSDPGRVTYGHYGLAALIVRAYDVQDDQVICPDWMSNGAEFGYTVTATMPPDTTKENFRLMLQDLLAERFDLKFHHASRLFPGYELVVAPGGPKLKEAVTTPEPAQGKPPVVMNGGKPDAKGFPVGIGRIGPRIGTWGMYRGRYRFSMSEFARRLLPYMINESNGAGVMAPLPRVADRTGLRGTFEFTLEFNGADIFTSSEGDPLMRAQQNQAAMNPASLPAGSAPAEGDRTGPSIFVALEKQLGLQLRKVKDVSVDMLIVDSANKKPTPN